MLKVQGKDITGNLADVKFDLVKTYKGDISRTQYGKIVNFPNAFVITGFTFSFIGTRADIRAIEQIFLSADVVDIVYDFNASTRIKGSFSCTSNACTELRDKGERSLQLTITLVSDGTDITKEDGSLFAVTYNSATVITGAFGKIYELSAGYIGKTVNGFVLPVKNGIPVLLVLGDTVIQ